jgi:hypothetical protein
MGRAQRLSVAVNVPAMTHTVEQNLFTFNVIADAVVTYTDTPLADGNIGKLASLVGVALEVFKHHKYPPVSLRIESAHIATEAVGNDEAVARHVRSV